LVTLVAGFCAGGLGALLGLGGAIILIPVLNLGIGLPYRVAAGISLMTVLATSSFVSRDPNSRPFINGRLAVLLLTLTVIGATAGQRLLWLPDATSERIFGLTAVVVSIVMISRVRLRNVIQDANVDPGALGGRFHDADSGREVVYRIRRLPLAFAIALLAGVVSTVVGIGGGILLVPMLNSWCGVPLRAAAATSALMIGLTAVPGLVGHHADLTLPTLELAAVLGVIAGSKVGFWVSARSPVQSLKLLMAGILAVVGAVYLIRGGLSSSGAATMSSALPVDPAPAWFRVAVDVGIMLLVAVPVLNVIGIGVAEARRRGWAFVAAAVAVLVLIALNVARML
jgi:uncharacterized membrane protein YfcA